MSRACSGAGFAGRTSVPGQLRERPLSQTLEAAWIAARLAGVTRLADLTGMAPLGIPVFQAVRPMGRLFSVSQGKGLTPLAAQVSALLESVETDLAERLPAEGALQPLSQLTPEAIAIWHRTARDRRAIHVDPDAPHAWTVARDLFSGRNIPIPWDLLSLDFARALPHDVQPSSIGLATGNSETEALVGSVAELLEHDLDCDLEAGGPVQMRARELDLDSVTDPVAAALLARLHRHPISLRVWSAGQDAGLAAFRCVLSDADWRSPVPPVSGNGCHPDRGVALIRAVLEAVQSRITMIAGAREDLAHNHYAHAGKHNADLILATLSFGPGPLDFARTPHHTVEASGYALEILLEVAARRSNLPLLAFRHRDPHPELAVVHCIGPGLRDADRSLRGQHQPPRLAPITASIRRERRPVLFVGPTLTAADVGDSIEVRPPAVCGDLAALLADPPPAVGLIDGHFELAPTVWHKEILDLLALGIRVLGGGSLGAIRAAELAPFGMIGVGAIFEAYRDGRVRRDDAVMICHAPAELGSQPLTLALADAEAALDRADLPPAVRRQLQRIVRTTDFRDRSWGQCLANYRRRTGAAAPIDAATLDRLSDRKRQDALALVALLATIEPGATRPRPPITAHYASLLASRLPALRAGPS